MRQSGDLTELGILVEVVVMLGADSLVQIFPGDLSNMSSLLAVEAAHLPQSVWSKDFAS